MFEPIGFNLLVKPEKTKEEKINGIIRPTTTQTSLRQGQVVAAGKGEVVDGSFLENDIKAGDKIVFDAMATQEYEVGGEKHYFVMRQYVKAKVID